MEEMSSAVAVTVSLATIMCDNSGSSNCTGPTLLKLETETVELLSDPSMTLVDSSCPNWNANFDCANSEIHEVASSKADVLETKRIPESSQSFHDVPESEEDEILSVGEEPNLSTVELLPIDPTSDLSVPLNTASDSSLPIAVEIEGIDNGQLVAKVISLEERSIRRRLSEDILTVPTKPDEECSSGPTIKASVVSVRLSNEQDSSKGGVKSVFELDCLPLWGSVSICGHRPEMEDAVMAVPHFMKIPIKMFIGDYGIDGISRTLTHLTSHFYGVYDGHGGSQVCIVPHLDKLLLRKIDCLCIYISMNVFVMTLFLLNIPL